MIYSIEFTDVADAEVQVILLWLIENAPEYVERWQEGLEGSVSSLSHFPARCPLAPEDNAFDIEVRQLLYGSYRILFTLVDVDRDGERETVRILHVRHGARRWLNEPSGG
ncbi:MAG TPA: type II toxin-antitoxin system RelE/ParE family toxin [Capsulimonadaceae bacterium]|nr:type II toxin-antitoxin system RelE/ParE family toxin [Capsulimonadaceae bacterium]